MPKSKQINTINTNIWKYDQLKSTKNSNSDDRLFSYTSDCHIVIKPDYRVVFLFRVFQALRQFFERVPWELSYPLLFCSCPDQACAERRRRTIVPSCSHQERHKPNCLELRHTCRSDALCRWAAWPSAVSQARPAGCCIHSRSRLSLMQLVSLMIIQREEELISEISCWSV